MRGHGGEKRGGKGESEDLRLRSYALICRALSKTWAGSARERERAGHRDVDEHCADALTRTSLGARLHGARREAQCGEHHGKSLLSHACRPLRLPPTPCTPQGRRPPPPVAVQSACITCGGDARDRCKKETTVLQCLHRNLCQRCPGQFGEPRGASFLRCGPCHALPTMLTRIPCSAHAAGLETS